MSEENNAENNEEATAATEAPLQEVDLVKQELDKVKRQGPRTEAEKAAFTLKKNAERAKELGIDPAEVLGISQAGEEVLDKNTPLTVGMYEQMEKGRAQRTSLQLAEDIADENERELTKHYLTTRIVPSGDPQEDLRLARGMVNTVKTAQILEETARRGAPKGHASGAGAPPKVERDLGELTAAEMPYMKAPWNMTKEQILKARPKV